MFVPALIFLITQLQLGLFGEASLTSLPKPLENVASTLDVTNNHKLLQL